MRILIICTSLYGGGAEKIISLLSQKINGQIIIATFNRKKKILPYGGHVINLNFKPTKNFLRKAINFFIRIYTVSQLKKRIKPDVVISFMQPPNLLNLITKDNAKTIISIRNFDIIKYKSANSFFLRLEHRFFNFFIKKADTIVTVSEELKETTIKTYQIAKEKVIAIYNGCDIDRIREYSKSALNDQIKTIFKDPVIINAGKLELQKGQIQLIKIFKKLKNKRPKLRLIILGKGSLKPNLIEYAHSLKLKVLDFETNKIYSDEDVVFFGFLDNPFNLIKNSEIFVLSSHYEGFPNVMIEAMACGTPIVSSNCPSGPKEILLDMEDTSKKYGLLLPVLEDIDLEEDIISDKEKVWFESINQLLNDELQLLKYQNMSKERVANFSLNKLVNNWNEVIISNINS